MTDFNRNEQDTADETDRTVGATAQPETEPVNQTKQADAAPLTGPQNTAAPLYSAPAGGIAMPSGSQETPISAGAQTTTGTTASFDGTGAGQPAWNQPQDAGALRNPWQQGYGPAAQQPPVWQQTGAQTAGQPVMHPGMQGWQDPRQMGYPGQPWTQQPPWGQDPRTTGPAMAQGQPMSQGQPYLQPGPGVYPGAYPGMNAMPGGAGPKPPKPPKTGRHAEEDRYEDLKTSSFYNESYRKPGKGRMKGLVGPMIAIGLVCSILGGVVTGGVMMLYGPFSRNAAAGAVATATTASDGTVRKVEIVDKTDEPVTAIAEKAAPSVVGINVEYTYSDSFFGTQEGGGQGSGIIISQDGYILTNNHVVEAAANTGTSRKRFQNTGRITVILPNQPDKSYEATIVGLDAKSDIAVIKIDAKNLPVAEIGDSDNLKIGELAVAIGNPAGLEYMGSVTAGIISGLNREVDTGDGKMLKLIQTDAAISPGNSGGALLNGEGQVIGVNSSKIGGTSYEGLGFAIPIKDAMGIATSLMKDGFVVRPQIGVSIDNTFTADVAKANKVPEGVLVGDVTVGGAADKAGVLAYDIITEVNGVKVTTFDELETEKNKFKPGDKITLTVYRIPEDKQPDQGETVKIELTLGSTADAQ